MTRGRISSTANVARPIASAVVFVWSRPCEEGLALVDEAVGVGREAEQLGELAHDDRDREPVHVADLHLLGEQVGDEAELAEAEADLDRARPSAPSSPRARSASRRVVRHEQRHDRREDQRRDRGIRAEHQDPRGTEERVADETGDRRVEAGDGGKARELRVRHALRHEDRRRARCRRRGRSGATSGGRSGASRCPAPTARRGRGFVVAVCCVHVSPTIARSCVCR